MDINGIALIEALAAGAITPAQVLEQGMVTPTGDVPWIAPGGQILSAPAEYVPTAYKKEIYAQAIAGGYVMPEEGGVEQAGLGGLLGPAAGLVKGVPVIGGALAALLGIAGAGYGIYQALGGGAGGGIGGVNLLGGDEFTMGGVEFGGPGLPEPSANVLIKEWHVSYDWGRLQYYLVRTARGARKVAMYNTRTKLWKVWNWPKPHLAIIGKNMPSHKMLTRLRRNLSRHSADARTLLKVTSPGSLKQHKYHRRRN